MKFAKTIVMAALLGTLTEVQSIKLHSMNRADPAPVAAPAAAPAAATPAATPVPVKASAVGGSAPGGTVVIKGPSAGSPPPANTTKSGLPVNSVEAEEEKVADKMEK